MYQLLQEGNRTLSTDELLLSASCIQLCSSELPFIIQVGCVSLVNPRLCFPGLKLCDAKPAVVGIL